MRHATCDVRYIDLDLDLDSDLLLPDLLMLVLPHARPSRNRSRHIQPLLSDHSYTTCQISLCLISYLQSFSDTNSSCSTSLFSSFSQSNWSSPTSSCLSIRTRPLPVRSRLRLCPHWLIHVLPPIVMRLETIGPRNAAYHLSHRAFNYYKRR